MILAATKYDFRFLLPIFTFIVIEALPTVVSGQQEDAQRSESIALVTEFLEANCLDCHSSHDPELGFDIESVELSEHALGDTEFSPDPFEKILRKVSAGQMPPPDASQPDETESREAMSRLAALLDKRQQEFPTLAPVGTIRRLTRTEYQNSIRDLLGVEIDATEFLPEDPASYGFDNITVEGLSPMLLNRYINAAEVISRGAIGASDNGPVGMTVRIPADRSQETHVAGLPFGTRGGTTFTRQFVRGGQYEISLKLTRDRDEKVEGLNRKHEVDILLDRKLVKRFEVTPPKKEKKSGNYLDYSKSDVHLNLRLGLAAGTHEITVTFPQTSASLQTIKRQPFDASFNRHRHPRRSPALFQVSLIGPLSDGSVGRTASRVKVLGEYADQLPAPGDESIAARKVLGDLMRRAYRRELTEGDYETPMNLFGQTNATAGFEPAIEFAVASVLVNPNFLFRVERAPDDLASGEIYPLTPFELASRLSFFIWSSLPDEKLLSLAESGELLSDDVLSEQVQRMLADERADALVANFASQWLYLKNLPSMNPDLRSFPDFDDNLRQAFRGETEHLFRYMMETDGSVLSLINSDFTFLNQRLAQHYGIGNVAGSHFRRVDLPPDSRRGGILRHGSILMVTSYATRTAPTIRGNWILENLLGTPAPPPPPNVPNLTDNNSLAATSVRQRLSQHRTNPACAACHDLMDPIGFALENFDAVGRWRDYEGEIQVDSEGTLPDGREISNVSELEQGILNRPEVFVRTVTEKLLTYGLGRIVDAGDGPAVRKTVRYAAENDFRFSAIVESVVLSRPFRFRSRP